MGKKVVRVIGYVLCGLMLAVCIFLIVTAAAFRSSDIVNVFGVNIFVVQTDEIQTAPRNSALIVQKCELSDVINGKLLLYTKGENKNPTTGYAKEYYAEDGVYYIKVQENGREYTLPESDLVGRADYCSIVLGGIIGFVKSPFGMFCIAVLPCIALVLYDIIRAFAARRPLPEVIPQVKNMPDDEFVSPSGISVSDDGKGTYSRNTVKSGGGADEILFSYAARQRKSASAQRPIIPLTDKTPDISDAKTAASAEKSVKELVRFNAEMPQDKVIFRNNSEKKGEKTINPSEKTGKTAEIPDFAKSGSSDAFFTQSRVPQIGRQLPKKPQVSVEELREDEKNAAFPTRTASKRSTQIIANKRVEDLMRDDDDVRDKTRYEVDDILSGLSNKH